jgi:FolB domain-containing protein
MDTIRIDGLELRCIVGVRSYERRREQPLRIDVRLGLDLRNAGKSGRISDTADYARVADEVTALLRFREYRLLEVAAEEAAAMLLGVHPAVLEVSLRLDKPQALAGRARGASVEITRSREVITNELCSYGTRRELLRSDEATLELLSIDPGATAELEDPRRRLEWLVQGELGGLQEAGHASPAAGPTALYRNVSAHPATVFRCLTSENTERLLAAE